MSKAARTLGFAAILALGVNCTTGDDEQEAVLEELKESEERSGEGGRSRAQASGAEENIPLEPAKLAVKDIPPVVREPAEEDVPEVPEPAATEEDVPLEAAELATKDIPSAAREPIEEGVPEVPELAVMEEDVSPEQPELEEEAGRELEVSAGHASGVAQPDAPTSAAQEGIPLEPPALGAEVFPSEAPELARAGDDVPPELPELAKGAIPPAALDMTEGLFQELLGNAAPPLEAPDVPGVEAEAADAAIEEAATEVTVAAEGAAPEGVEGQPASAAHAPRRLREDEPGLTIAKELGPAESFALSTDEVRAEQETIRLVTERATLELLLTSWGGLRTLSLSGQEGERVTFELVAGPKTLACSLVVGRGDGRISCSTVKGFTATADEAGLNLRVEAVSWVFTLVAEDVGPEGVEVWHDSLATVLHDGQRMDSKRTDEDEIVFVISGPGQPRELMPWEFARTKWESGPRTAGEPEQVMDSPLRPWQTLFLPIIDIDVLRPEDVSP